MDTELKERSMNHQTEKESQSNEVVILSPRKRFISSSSCRYYYQIPKRCLFIQGLVITASSTEIVAVSVLMTYLTEVREETLVKAAATVNILEVLGGILSVPASFLKDYLGCYSMVMLTTHIYINGMVLLGVSALLRTPNPTKYSTYLIENLLLYVGLCLIALGKAGSYSSCVEDFFGEQLEKDVSHNDIDEKRNRARQMFWMRASKLLGLILGTVLLAYVDDWKAHYGICAVTMQFALVVFFIGSLLYPTMGIDAGSLELKCFEKAASITDTCSPSPSANDIDEQGRKNLQRKDEVKENKKNILALLLPLSVTFLIHGIVSSIGSTFFLEQANSMKDSEESGIRIPPLQILIVVGWFSRTLVTICMERLLRNRLTGVRKVNAMLIRIGVGLLFTIICCATAQAVEAKRLGIVVKYGLQDITGDYDEDPVIPMSIYWLLPQFIFLGIINGLAGDGMEIFFESELPMCMKKYASQVTSSVTAIGKLLSVGLVFIATKASTVGGGSSWFGNTVNWSHLDHFYRSLTILCFIFCLVYAYVSTAYIHKKWYLQMKRWRIVKD